MGNRRMGLSRLEALLEAVDRELTLTDSTLLNPTITSNAAGTFTGAFTASGADQTTGTGAGLVGTGTAPHSSIVQIGDQIITTIKIDLTGLKKKSDVGDVIGLAGTNSAYLAIWQAATHGVLHKIEISCVELPTATNALLDFDLIAHDTTTLTYDGDASGGTSLTAMGGNIALGQTYQDITVDGQPTAGQAIYLAEGATSGDNVYTAGMIIVRLYGTATF
jgi:hypothetical protein